MKFLLILVLILFPNLCLAKDIKIHGGIETHSTTPDEIIVKDDKTIIIYQ